MPLLGYAGYLPFGVECAVVVAMVLARNGKKDEGLNYFEPG
jgi:hypothetical protein